MRQFESKHEDLTANPMEFFKKEIELSANKQKIASFSELNEKLLHMSL